MDTAWNDKVNVLLQKVQRKDEQALRSLYDFTAPKLLAVALRITRDKAEAEDVLQEVYIKVWDHAKLYSGSGTAWGWLCVLTGNRALDYVRSRSSKKTDTVEDFDGLLNSFQAPTLATENILLTRCLGSLEEQQRKSILMSFIYGYRHQEIVDKLVVPLGTIKSTIRRGLQRLKQCLTA
jgi:RNA polymerase sigma-70 factor (ECF subfamily)